MELLEPLRDEKSLGGVRCHKVELLAVGPHHTFPDVIQDKMTGEITPAGGEEWMDFFGQEDTFHFSESPEEVNGTTQYNSKLDCVVSKDTINRLRIIERVHREGFILRIQDNNGLFKIIGNVDRGVYAKYSRDNQILMQESNRIMVSWNCSNRRPTPEWSES